MKEPPTQLTDTPDTRKDTIVRFPTRDRERFLLWVDGVGGFQICMGPRILLGHAALDSDVDVPILADVSRHHAWLERDPQGYFLEAIRATQVNHQPATKTILRPGDLITLGRSCQFSFTQSVPVSASARLDLVSGHRFWRALHGVLLMAETLVLGPGSSVHVQVPDLREPLVIFRHKTGLAVRYPGRLWINDQPAGQRGTFEPGARVTVEDISLSLERIGGP